MVSLDRKGSLHKIAPEREASPAASHCRWQTSEALWACLLYLRLLMAAHSAMVHALTKALSVRRDCLFQFFEISISIYSLDDARPRKMTKRCSPADGHANARCDFHCKRVQYCGEISFNVESK